MLRLDLKKLEGDWKAMRLSPPTNDHFDLIVDQPCDVYDGGQLAVSYRPVSDAHQLLWAVRRIRYEEGFRTGGKIRGLKSRSRIFGFRPRITIRKDWCAVASIEREHPTEHAVLMAWAERASEFLRSASPERHARQLEMVQAVRPEWRMPGGAFTSGIANHDNPLRYHFDTGNFSGCWSAMYAFTNDIEGGHLVVPAYRVAFSFKNPAVIAFDGQGLLHGVSPFRALTPRCFRYSVVYYALKQMCHCGSPGDELQRIRSVKTQRESKRVGASAPALVVQAAAAAAGVDEGAARAWWSRTLSQGQSRAAAFVAETKDMTAGEAGEVLLRYMVLYP